MAFERMLDKSQIPAQQDIFDYLGKNARKAWQDIVSFIENNYSFTPETVFGGTKYGWAIRYRRNGKSLCTLHPEQGAFTILIVLGAKETEQALAELNNFNLAIADVITGSKQFHDGRWLWIRVMDTSCTEDIKHLLQIKKKPNKKN